MGVNRRALGFRYKNKAQRAILQLLRQCCAYTGWYSQQQVMEQHCNITDVHSTVHRGSPTSTLCWKWVCPELNLVYTALVPL